ncbi:thioredoxin [Limnothrix sp. FACHB-881]|nr:thioredoxin [Limnothrix sp. FACHB-1083]MBD2192446.1 thioredoxin [Limnothrix sp. FACHB-1088]MBD2553315.1 thioredoxin [Limnothrix sp. FACHB-708]MBD2590661.1 thioredoxin [Limnothrix sp. FACHB-406]MBD2635281.1 thioredoxin [Limnothrix sp. FACHB-881]OCQ95213.1 thiol reductase thioredoxin [Limnothrix sp. P13C2]PIB14470.1 thioredoxin [Limnothrix sp. PR1529]
MLDTMDDSSFDREVLQTPGLVLVNFWAPWCGLCRLIDPLLNKLRSDWGESIKLVNVNADSNLRLANSYRLTTLPTVILFQDGKPIFRLDRFEGKEEFLRHLNRAVNQVELSRSLTS